MTSRPPAPIVRANMDAHELANHARLTSLIRAVVDGRPLSEEKYAEIARQTELGVRISRENVIDILEKILDRRKMESHRFWLETGVLSDGVQTAGMYHILDRHLKDFEQQGFGFAQIVDLLIAATQTGEFVGYQRSKKRHGCPIFAVIGPDGVLKIAVSYGTNGFIVGANPVSGSTVDSTTQLDKAEAPQSGSELKPQKASAIVRAADSTDFSHQAFPSESITGYTLFEGHHTEPLFWFKTDEGGRLYCDTDWLPKNIELEMDRLEDLRSSDDDDSAAKLTYGMLKFGKSLHKLTGKPVMASGVGNSSKVDCSSSEDVDRYWTEWVLWTEFRVYVDETVVSSDPPVLRELSQN